MITVQAKNKWMLRASEFAKQIMEDVAAKPIIDSDVNIKLNEIVFSCQGNCKRILQKNYINFESLSKIEGILQLSDQEKKNPLLLFNFFQFFTIFMEKQTYAVILQERQQSFLQSKPKQQKKVPSYLEDPLEAGDSVDDAFFSEQMKIVELLVTIFFELIDFSLNQYSIDEIIMLSNEYHNQRPRDVALTEKYEEVLTVLLVLVPVTMHSLQVLLHFLLELLSALLSSTSVSMKSEAFIESRRDQEIGRLVTLIWKLASSSLINALMKWINVLNEYSFGYNPIITKLSKFVIGSSTLRGNMLMASHLLYQCVVKINKLAELTAKTNKPQQRAGNGRNDSRAQSIGSVGSYASYGSSSRSANSSRLNSYSSQQTPLDQQQKASIESFLLTHLEPLITVSIELAENIILQNSVYTGPLGNPTSLFLQDSFFYQCFDQEIIAATEIVTSFYSMEVTSSTSASSESKNLFDSTSYYYNDNINSSLKVLKELSIIAHHRVFSVFLCFHVLKCYTAAVNFYLNYAHIFSFDSRDYTSSLNESSVKMKRQLMKRKKTLAFLKREIREQPDNPKAQELSSSTTSVPVPVPRANPEAGPAGRSRRNVFANEIGQFAYRVLGMLSHHHTSLNICHKGLLFLRLVMRDAFLDKHLVEDLFSMQLYTVIDPWLVHISLGLADDDDEPPAEEEDQAHGNDDDDEEENHTHSSHEMKSIAENDSLAATTVTHDAPPQPFAHSSLADPEAMSVGSSHKDDGSHSVVSETTSVTTKTNELNPAQYLLRIRKLYIPKTFKGETEIKKHKSKLREGTQQISAQETQTLIDILSFIGENHIQSQEVMEQLFLIIYEIATRSNLIKYLLVENNISIPIQRYADNQKRDQHYILALSELSLEALVI